MTPIYPTIRIMTETEARTYGFFRPGLMLEHSGLSYRLSASTKDNVQAFTSGPTLLVLSLNTGLDYIGLDVYLGQEQEPIDSIFLQGDVASEALGDNWHILPLSSLATRLFHLFDKGEIQ
jgi:hypothetical protein